MRAHLGFGSNLGDRLGALSDALRAIDGLPGTAVIAVSRVYESESWPDPDAPPYANAVAVIDTGLDADVLLGMFKELETTLGRVEGPRNAPRPIDIDILLFGDEEWASEALTIPHPRLGEREFVVVPLLEVDPFVTLPDGAPVGAEEATAGRVTGVLGVVPGFEDVTHVLTTDARAHEDEEWVTVAEAVERPSTPDAGLIFKRTVLEAEGIPFVWDPYAPEMASNPYGLVPSFKLKVPASLEERARIALAQAEAAPPEIGDGGQFL